MKKHLSSIIICFIFLVGVGLVLYPMISNYVNQKHSTKVIVGYNRYVANLNVEALNQDIAEAEKYNLALAQTPDAFYKPAMIEGYQSTLDITGTGIMGFINIDKIGVELPIYHGVEKEVLQTGVGHLPGSSFPVGGSSTHAVLSGHRGLPSAKLFTDLDKLELGDVFTITVHDRVLTYVVDQIKIVLPTESEDLLVEKGKDYCTLLTCTPYGINSHRLLVRGVRDLGEATKTKIYVGNEAFRMEPLVVAIFLAIPLMILALTVLTLSDRSGRRPKRKRQSKKRRQE